MTFLQPAFLWGMLAVAIPVLIHFWHQKRGEVLPWAAMQWLNEESEQQKRGFQFNDWLLLAVRCLLIVLVSMLLARPVWERPADPKAVRIVHLAASDSLVTTAYRFELEQARQRGESVVLMPMNNPLRLQTTLDSLQRPDVRLHLYVRNEAALADVPSISVPDQFSLHTAMAPLPSDQPASDQQKPFAGLKNPLVVQITYANPLERQTVTAALRALASVYALNLEIRTTPTAQPDWMLSNKLPNNPKQTTLYTLSGGSQPKELMAQPRPNVVWTADTLTPQTSERVATGQLPEWLGEQLLAFYKRNPAPPALTRQELTGLFVPVNVSEAKTTGPVGRTREEEWLLLALLLTVGVERWMALRKDAK